MQAKGAEAYPCFDGTPSKKAAMSVKEMRAELAALGGSTEGCYERAEMEARLFEVRAIRKHQVQNLSRTSTNTHPYTHTNIHFLTHA